MFHSNTCDYFALHSSLVKEEKVGAVNCAEMWSVSSDPVMINRWSLTGTRLFHLSPCHPFFHLDVFTLNCSSLHLVSVFISFLTLSVFYRHVTQADLKSSTFWLRASVGATVFALLGLTMYRVLLKSRWSSNTLVQPSLPRIHGIIHTSLTSHNLSFSCFHGKPVIVS